VINVRSRIGLYPSRGPKFLFGINRNSSFSSSIKQDIADFTNTAHDFTLAISKIGSNKFPQLFGCVIPSLEDFKTSLTQSPLSEGCAQSSIERNGPVIIQTPAVVLEDEWKYIFSFLLYAVAHFIVLVYRLLTFPCG